MLWNQFQREQRIATLQAEEQHLGPQILVDAIPGQVRIGSVNMEKSNPDKLENLVHLAAQCGWEITVVSECAPTSRNGSGSSGNLSTPVKVASFSILPGVRPGIVSMAKSIGLTLPASAPWSFLVIRPWPAVGVLPVGC